MKRRADVWWPAIAQMVVIFGISGIPNLTHLPGDLSDHVGHFVGYALLGALVLRACADADWRGVTAGAAWRAWMICIVYAASDEFHQRFVPGRSSALDDWGADACGAALAVLVILVGAVGGRSGEREV